MSKFSIYVQPDQLTKLKEIGKTVNAVWGGQGSVSKICVMLAEGKLWVRQNPKYIPPSEINIAGRQKVEAIGITLGKKSEAEANEKKLKIIAKRLGYRDDSIGNPSRLLQAIADGKVLLCREETPAKPR